MNLLHKETQSGKLTRLRMMVARGRLARMNAGARLVGMKKRGAIAPCEFNHVLGITQMDEVGSHKM